MIAKQLDDILTDADVVKLYKRLGLTENECVDIMFDQWGFLPAEMPAECFANIIKLELFVGCVASGFFHKYMTSHFNIGGDDFCYDYYMHSFKFSYNEDKGFCVSEMFFDSVEPDEDNEAVRYELVIFAPLHTHLGKGNMEAFGKLSLNDIINNELICARFIEVGFVEAGSPAYSNIGGSSLGSRFTLNDMMKAFARDFELCVIY